MKGPARGAPSAGRTDPVGGDVAASRPANGPVPARPALALRRDSDGIHTRFRPPFLRLLAPGRRRPGPHPARPGLVLLALLVAACGADGPPLPVRDPAPSGSGITLSGQATIGISGRSR